MIIDFVEGQLRVEQLGMTMTVVKTGLRSAPGSTNCGKYCGMLLIAAEVMRDELSALDSIPIPLVVVDSTVPNHYCSSVCMNSAENVYIALQYCKEYGYTKLGYLGSTTKAGNLNERYVAFLRYVKELNFQLNPKNGFHVKPIMLGAHDDFFRILDQNPMFPPCSFAENDTITLGATEALKEKGYKILNNVSLIGFDDTPYSFISSPALTTTHVQRKIIGKQLVTQLIWLIEDPRFMSVETQITGRLVERSSVKHLA